MGITWEGLKKMNIEHRTSNIEWEKMKKQMNIEQGMSNSRSFLKETNQYSLLRYSAVPCSAVLRFKII